MAREINLVPDVKGEMIKALKLRNLIFFLCIVVAAASVAVTVVVGTIMGGQAAILEGNKQSIEKLSNKLKSYSELNDFLTIKDQVGNISTLTNNKKVLSRTFGILTALIPSGPDVITISELSVDLTNSSAPVLSFDAQADAKKEPYIDYNVLDSFKKSMDYMRYDYGNYVNKSGNNIPAYCMIEYGDDGALFNEPSRGIYAFWTINAEGCNPAADNTSEESNSTDTITSEYSTEDYNGQTVVRIWRTPQYDEWYHEEAPEGNTPHMSLTGEISNVEHFQSACIAYTGTIVDQVQKPTWTETNESCQLVAGGISGIRVTGSSNGRSADEQLVLRFSAQITLTPEAYLFNNHHFIALAPSGHHNVTDSYVQIQSMFSERAADCDESDVDCKSEQNLKGDE